MIDLQASEPTFFWTYDSISAHEYWGYKDKIWISDRLNRPSIHTSSISFDAPEDWGYGKNVPIKFECDAEKEWVSRSKAGTYLAVRTDTATHVILTGTWKDSPYGGAFVAVLPKLDITKSDGD